MGIQASATCVMNFDEAMGYLVGEPNKGLAAMFTMMNYERLGVGIQGLASAERSYQNAREYARDRLQSRAADRPAGQGQGRRPDHRPPGRAPHAADHEGADRRAAGPSPTYVAMQLDTAKFSEDAGTAQAHEDLVALLTPVAKAFLTDLGLESTVHGQQVFGGHGYIREWGQEQLVRDVRIAQIYEGTNGIQALDLLGRKVVGSGGAFYRLFSDEIRHFTSRRQRTGRVPQPLAASLDQL